MKIDNLYEENDKLNFTISEINVSIANAIRRIILSEIPCVVFKTSPYKENLVDIEINTSRMNNELIKQRLECIPIFIDDLEAPIQNYTVMIDKKNDSDNMEFVTTEDFKIFDKQNNKELSSTEIRKIFPSDPQTKEFIDIARLRPALSSEVSGEHLKLTADLTISTAKENSAYNIVSTCSYGNTLDQIKIEQKITELMEEYDKKEYTQDKIDFLIEDWRLLNSEMYFIPDSFDFKIETIGQFSNRDIIIKATQIMKNKLSKFLDLLQSDEDIIQSVESTLENGYDIILKNEDYTLGKAIEYILYKNHYDKTSDKLLSFCGFKKPHPHIDESLIRIGFVENLEKSAIINVLINSINELEKIFDEIENYFKQ